MENLPKPVLWVRRRRHGRLLLRGRAIVPLIVDVAEFATGKPTTSGRDLVLSAIFGLSRSDSALPHDVVTAKPVLVEVPLERVWRPLAHGTKVRRLVVEFLWKVLHCRLSPPTSRFVTRKISEDTELVRARALAA